MTRYHNRLSISDAVPRTIRLIGAGAICLLTGLIPAAGTARAEMPAVIRTPVLAAEYTAQDSLQSSAAPTSDDQQVCLAGLCWQPAAFLVQLEPAAGKPYDSLVRFPSPIVSGRDVNDRVALEWYRPSLAADDQESRPAVVVVHESGRGMTVGRLFAQSFQKQGYHAFLLHLPGYGARHWGGKPEPKELFTLLKQGIADVRRARDAVAVLEGVDEDQIFLQGTSLGGIVSATVAGLDRGFAGIFLMLAGGDLVSLVQNGQQDAAKVRTELERSGLTEQELRAIAHAIEPLRLASRVDPQRVWLYSGKYDTVVPLANATAWASAAGLSAEHHVLMPVDHYSGLLFFPAVMKHMDQQIQAVAARQN